MKAHTHAFSKLTPKEAAELLNFTTTDIFEHVKSLYDYYSKNCANSGDSLWEYISILALMYNSGRVDGIREERARKAAK